MEKEEINALRYAGAESPGFKLNQGQEMDYLLAITIAKAARSRI
ncbi:MAG: hypothetical protein ABRQ24_01675 [Syntrophomonadaceae bacterium]